MGTTTNNSWPYPAATDAAGNGALNIQNLATAIDTSVGTGLLTWTDFDTFTLGGTGWSWATSTKNGRYSQLGKMVHFDYTITLNGAVSAGTGAPTFSLPVAANTNTSEYMSTMTFTDTSAGIVYAMNFSIESTTAVGYVQTVSGANLRIQSWTSTTSPATIASGDVIRLTGWYEAA